MKKYFLKFIGISFGALLVAISISLFMVPHNFLSGGISGLSLLIFYKTGIPISVLLYIFNIPIVAIGVKHVGKTFTLFSIAGITLMSSFIFLLRTFQFPALTNNSLLAAIFAGTITGIGGGIVFKCGGTLGGTDIIGVIIKKRYGIDLGTFLLYSNIAIMGLSLFFFAPEIIMYTIVSMYFASKFTDKIQEGINTKTTVMIISDQYEKIANGILKHMHRGVTYLNAEGGFLHKEKKVIMCVITRFELSKVKDIAIQIDKNAFISISETKEVLGRGF